MKIITWNRLWSLPQREQTNALARAQSIHPFGRKKRKSAFVWQRMTKEQRIDFILS